MSDRDRLAIHGGMPVRDTRQRPWPKWPIYSAEEEQALLTVLHSGSWWSVEGAECNAFEQEFASFQDARYGIACTNGTAALEIALRALEIGCGDEVIVPPYTFVATASAVLAVGATPVFVDIDGSTLNIDPTLIEAAINPRTRAVIPVHIAGRPADMDAILALARKHSLYVIEDAAQAHSAAWRGTKVGALGDLGTFSFQASKNLNAGEGGLIVSNQEKIADVAWSVANVGRLRGGKWYEHHILGGNFRLTEFQGALLRKQLQRLPEQTALRSRNAARLRQLFQGLKGTVLPAEDTRISIHAYHLFTFRYQADCFGGIDLGSFVAALSAEGIPCSTGYVPLYREGLFAHNAMRKGVECQAVRRIDYPNLRLEVCEQVCRDTVWLPQTLLLSALTDMDDVAYALEKLQRAFGTPTIQ